MEDELTAEEKEQLLRFQAFRKVSLGILRGWAWLFALVFCLLAVVFTVAVVWKSAHSNSRFEAVTRLLFTPRTVVNVQNISDKQLLSILERSSLKRRVGRAMSMEHSERESLEFDLDLKQERKPSNLFTLSARSPTWVGAVRKVNTYAEVLIAEYIAFRTRELSTLAEAIELRRNNLQEQIAANEGEESVLKSKAGEPSPVEALTMLNALISDQRRNYSMLCVQVANEEARKKNFQEELGDLGTAVIKCAPQIRKKGEEIKALDDELDKLREIYTDINPKVKGKLEDRRALVEEYSELLRENGIDGIKLEDVEVLEKAALGLAECQMKLEVLAENQRALTAEIKASEAKSETLTSVIRPLERLRIKREELERTLREQDEKLGNIDYLRTTARNDVQQIERAGGAGDKNPLRVKNFIIAFGAAFVCTGALAVWVLFLELLFGKIRGSDEMTAFEDIFLLGSLPKPGVVPKAIENDVFGVVALNFNSAPTPKGIVLVCRLPGSPVQTGFFTSLEWNLSMSGQRVFSVNIVPSADFEPPEGSETMISLVRKDAQGWFPVENRYMLAPTELQILKADFDALRNDFECIFVLMPDGLQHGGNFLGQLMTFCDSILVCAGAHATPRSELAYVRKIANAGAKPMLGIVTGASAKTVKREMEVEE